METKKPCLFTSALRYAIILAVISILYSLLLYAFGAIQNKVLAFLSYVLLLAVIIWAIKDYRDKKLGGFITLGTGFKLGFLIGLLAGFVSAIYTFLFFKYFDPELVNQMWLQAEEAMLEKNPNLDESQIEVAMSYTRRFMQPTWMAIWGFVWNAILSAVLALIVAAIMKKEENPMKVAE